MWPGNRIFQQMPKRLRAVTGEEVRRWLKGVQMSVVGRKGWSEKCVQEEEMRDIFHVRGE